MFERIIAVPKVKNIAVYADKCCSAAYQDKYVEKTNFELFEEVILAYSKFICVFMENKASLGNAIVEEYLTGKYRPFFGNAREEAIQVMDRVYNQLISSALVFANQTKVSPRAVYSAQFKTLANNLNFKDVSEEELYEFFIQAYHALSDFVS